MDAIETTVDEPIGEAESAIRGALVVEGFGVLTEIDVAATFQAKLGVRRPPLKILGACNPSLAHRALALDPSLALVLPCNVVLEDVGDGRTHVSIADPRAMLRLGDPTKENEAHSLGEEASLALRRALDQLGG
ncbi:MAG TPA: DUF302 domain-containing protein [Candidatus Dormibacteraeota bacterium]|nr:DUF302 domain-containing protein [Candidatus Dormibacteraeota bacterium]